jgi:transglutaminase-like putative cysteine protease
VKTKSRSISERTGESLRFLRTKVYNALRSAVPTVLICLPMVLMLSAAVDDAKWVNDSSSVGHLLFWGMVCGWLLAATRWRGWLVAVYSLVFSGVFTALVVGQVVPPLRVVLATAYMPLVEGMRLRMVTFGLRAGGWIETLRAGGSVRDTGLFIFLLALIGWSAAAWMMFWFVRRKRALTGVLPIFILMAVNTHLSRQPSILFVVFILFVFLAVARSSFTYLQEGWRRRRVDFSEDLGPEWGATATLASVGVAIFALVFSLVGTPQGLKLLSDLVERSRQEMSDTANQLFGGVKPPPPVPNDKSNQEPFPSVDTPNLGEIGSPLPQGNRTIMWVGLSDPAPVPVEINGPPRELIAVRRHYWRSQIFSVYNGRGWEPAPLFAGETSPDSNPEVPRGRYLLTQRYEVEARHSGVLFSVSDPTSASGATSLRRISPDGSRLVEGRASAYQVQSLATNGTVEELDLAETNYPAEIRAAYLQLPATLPARVRQLAEEVTAGAETPYRQAEKIQDYLRLNYEYKLDAPLPLAGRDVVDYFLFDSTGGFCSHYASAMVVMLRVVGVPARVAAGYAMGGFDQTKRMYRVPASASHAWVEVFFPGSGWVEFEPTPAYLTFVYPESGASPASALRQLPEAPPEAVRQPSQLLWLLLPVGLVAVLWILFLWGRLEKRRLEMPGKAARKLYERVRRGLSRAGLPYQSSLTPDEFSAMVLPALELYPRLSEALGRVTRVYIQSAYSPREPSIDDVLMGESVWSESRGELLRLWVQIRLGRD